MKANLLRHLFAPALLCTLALPTLAMAEGSPKAETRPVIGLQQKRAIKVVFQITSGETANGLHKGLKALHSVYQNYLEEGVPPEEISLHAVIHGDAADYTLSNTSWNKYKSTTEGNPSTQLIEALIKQGVQLELCDSRRVLNGWEKSDIHPGVSLVSNAYHRLADLQLQGYAYIRQ